MSNDDDSFWDSKPRGAFNHSSACHEFSFTMIPLDHISTSSMATYIHLLKNHESLRIDHLAKVVNSLILV